MPEISENATAEDLLRLMKSRQVFFNPTLDDGRSVQEKIIEELIDERNRLRDRVSTMEKRCSERSKDAAYWAKSMDHEISHGAKRELALIDYIIHGKTQRILLERGNKKR